MPEENPLVRRARALRKDMSLPEMMLWNALRGSRLDGLRFRRQHPFGRYVLDFYCPTYKLAVEVDSYAHETEDRPRRDAIRDDYMASFGIRTLRIPAAEVLKSVDDTVATIRATLPPPTATRSPPPQGEVSLLRTSPCGGGGPKGRWGE
ncbi:MAG: DUF559 domain-containing protein [Caulobacter sp.]